MICDWLIWSFIDLMGHFIFRSNLKRFKQWSIQVPQAMLKIRLQVKIKKNIPCFSATLVTKVQRSWTLIVALIALSICHCLFVKHLFARKKPTENVPSQNDRLKVFDYYFFSEFTSQAISKNPKSLNGTYISHLASS